MWGSTSRRVQRETRSGSGRMEWVTQSRRGGELNQRKKGDGCLYPKPRLPLAYLYVRIHDTAEDVSAHGPAAAAERVICRLESMQSHANSRQAGRQAGRSCIVKPA